MYALTRMMLARAGIARSRKPNLFAPSSSFLPSNLWQSNIRHIRTFSSESDDPPSDPSSSGEVVVYEDEGTSMAPVEIPNDFPNVPIIAINRHPLFPGFIKHLVLKENEQLIELITRVNRDKMPYVGIFVKRDDENQSEVVNSISQIHTVGTFASVLELRLFPPMQKPKVLQLIVNAHRRIRILEPVNPAIPIIKPQRLGQRKLRKPQQKETETVQQEITAPELPHEERPIIYARTENVVDEKLEMTTEIKALMQHIVESIREIIGYSSFLKQHVEMILHPQRQVIDNPIYLCDFVATIMSSAGTEELQAIMQETSIRKRLELAQILLAKEKEVYQLKAKITKEVDQKMQESQRKYFLNEQLKAIKRELGIEKEDKQAIIEKMEERLANLKVPEYAMKVIKEEQTKLSFLDPHSSEFSISRNYLDWLTSIPWGKSSEEIKDVHWAKSVLDEDHYGMKDVKERILEFIAVGILKHQTNGKILCFHGPPGVGKTSIAKSIARALNREYYRFSVGGMTDVAEIKGHRRTYVGAMPGKLIQCLKKVQSENPLVLIDEVDKIGVSGYHGDPSSALLEVLDPEQNANFVDHFLDVPVDLSKVLFICTANVTDTIPGPLKDRMEMIEVSGYVAEEKMEIAKKYLVPKCRDKCALPEERLMIRDRAIDALIKSYCRESGVRNLEKHLEKIFRKAAFQLVGGEVATEPIVVDSENLKAYVGREKFTSDRLYELTPPGVIMGLAWTAMGGSALYIEATLSRRIKPVQPSMSIPSGEQIEQAQQSGGNLEATGHLGDVMKESMRTAYTVAKNVLLRKDPGNEFLEQAHIHVHVPEGAVPKDGPSAGCTVVSALLSLALNRPALQEMAMTGEISLTGKVLPIGGVKEKIIAAKRAGVKQVILPEENKKDYDDLAEFMKQDVTVYFVSHYDQIYDLIFP